MLFIFLFVNKQGRGSLYGSVPARHTVYLGSIPILEWDHIQQHLEYGPNIGTQSSILVFLLELDGIEFLLCIISIIIKENTSRSQQEKAAFQIRLSVVANVDLKRTYPSNQTLFFDSDGASFAESEFVWYPNYPNNASGNYNCMSIDKTAEYFDIDCGGPLFRDVLCLA